MATQDLASYQNRLHEWAASLLGPAPAIPVVIENICGGLGVKLKRASSVPASKSYLSIDPTKIDPISVLLPGVSNELPLTSFERLCVAHELAHYFLLKNFELLPRSKSEYWQHEELCDDFARHLLIPEQYIVQRASDTSWEPSAYLKLCGDVAAAAWIPWIHAAIRITERNPDVGYLRCDPLLDDELLGTNNSHLREPQRLLAGNLLGTIIVRKTSFPKQKGIRTRIKRGSLLHSAFIEMLEDSQFSNRRIQRDITMEMKSSPLNKFISSESVALAETYIASWAINIIIRSPAPMGTDKAHTDRSDRR